MYTKTIQEILKDLNGSKDNLWVATDGVKAITNVTKEDGNFVFNPAEGTLVKAFYNTETGEARLFMALLIKDSFE